MTECRRHIQTLQTSEGLTPWYPSRQRQTTDSKLNPKPATKLTDQLMAETVHGHAPIQVQSVNPGLTMAPLGERRLLVTARPLEHLGKERKRGKV